MTFRVAINGFGRIGRNILRAIVEYNRKDVTIVAINGFGDVATNAYLLKNCDLTQTQIVNNKLVSVLSRYDNEWGFSCRMSDTAVSLAKQI